MTADIDPFGFKDIELLKDQPLGTGSYGAVCKARCDELLCAAKVVHPTLFEMDGPSAKNIPLEKFRQECRFLCAVKHPNIVQFLGTWQEPDTRPIHLVLLMELCDESLTSYLKRCTSPYHVQVNICHDVALALVYLHTNGLIHRDLSSNNVLLVPGYRAKVTDFGMSRFLKVNSLTPLTLCPGTQVYMAPETLEEPPVYTAKLDCFSLGVLTIQIITREFPDPGPRFQTILDPRYTGGIRVPIPDEVRRESHISKIDTQHPLLPLIKKTLSYKEEERPTAVEICRSLAELKNATRFEESARAMEQPPAVVESASSKQPIDKESSDVERNINGGTNQRTDADINALQEKLRQAESRERDVATQLQTCKENAKREIEQRDNDIQGLKNKLIALQEKYESCLSKLEMRNDKQTTTCIGPTKQDSKRSLSLSWEITGETPQELFRGGAAALGGSIYCHSSSKRDILKFDPAKGSWSTLPQCKYSHFSLSVVCGKLTTIGGYDFVTTDQLFSFSPEEVSGRGKSSWVSVHGSMPTARCNAVSLCTDNTLIVAGGDATGYNDYLNIVEVMDINSGKWTTANSLPSPQLNLSVTVANDGRFYFAGGLALKGKNAMYSCSLENLLLPPPRGGRFRGLSQPKRPAVWRESSLPVTQTTLVTLQGRLLAIGGQNADRKSVADVYVYNEESDSWKEFGRLNQPRSRCLVHVDQDKIFCIGGQGEKTIEVATFLS